MSLCAWRACMSSRLISARTARGRSFFDPSVGTHKSRHLLTDDAALRPDKTTGRCGILARFFEWRNEYARQTDPQMPPHSPPFILRLSVSVRLHSSRPFPPSCPTARPRRTSARRPNRIVTFLPSAQTQRCHFVCFSTTTVSGPGSAFRASRSLSRCLPVAAARLL